ncbi:MAG: endonuclease/exonuclease/phosphatase family protein [Phycisphaerae bacterium]|nr:endonuclease/exonuclease/phosphatase family protein [Phycisphaerae bacterium]
MRKMLQKRVFLGWVTVLAVAAVVMAASTDNTNKLPTPKKADAETKVKTFTIASYNINYGNPNLKKVVEIIKNTDADVVAIQETNPESEKYLRRHLGKLYPHMKFHNSLWAGGFAFLAKTPLKKVKYLPQTHGAFGTYLTTVRLAGKTVQLANCHLHPTLPRENAGLKELIAVWNKTQTIRKKEIAAIISKLSPATPSIVLGDLNSLPGTTVPMYLEYLGYTDNYKAVTPENQRRETWRWVARNMEWKVRLDYIFTPKQCQIIKSKIIHRDASDHYLIFSTLRWENKPIAGKSKKETGGKTRKPKQILKQTPEQKQKPSPTASKKKISGSV